MTPFTPYFQPLKKNFVSRPCSNCTTWWTHPWNPNYPADFSQQPGRTYLQCSLMNHGFSKFLSYTQLESRPVCTEQHGVGAAYILDELLVITVGNWLTRRWSTARTICHIFLIWIWKMIIIVFDYYWKINFLCFRIFFKCRGTTVTFGNCMQFYLTCSFHQIHVLVFDLVIVFIFLNGSGQTTINMSELWTELLVLGPLRIMITS